MKNVLSISKLNDRLPIKSIALLGFISLGSLLPLTSVLADVQTPTSRATAASAVPDSPEKTRLLKIVEQCDEAIAKNSGNFKAYVDRAHAFFDLGNFALAAEDLSWALQLNPTDGRWYIWRAKCYSKMDKDDLAMADADKAIRMLGNSVPAYLVRGDLFEKAKQYPKAIADYTQAINLDTKSASALTKRAAAYKAMGDESNAEADLKAAAALTPAPSSTPAASTEPDLQTLAAAAAAASAGASTPPAATNGGAAVSTATAPDPATEIKINSVNLHDIIFGRVDNPAKAVQNLTTAISVSPLDQSLIYKRAQAYIHLDKLDSALNDMMNAIQNNPNSSNLYITRAWLYNTMGNSTMAQQDVTQAHFCNPTLSKDVTLDSIAAVHLKNEKK